MWDVSKFLENQEIDEGVSTDNQSGLVFTTSLYFQDGALRSPFTNSTCFRKKLLSVNGYAVQ